MSTESDEGALVGASDLVGDAPAVAAATVSAGVTLLLVPYTYGVAFSPPVESRGLLGMVVSNSDPAVRTHFFQHAVAYDAIELAWLFLATFALVAAASVRATTPRERRGRDADTTAGRLGGLVARRRAPVRLALAAGVAAGLGYLLVGTVGVAALPTLELAGPSGGGLRSEVPAVIGNALVLAAVATVATLLGVLGVDATAGGDA